MLSYLLGFVCIVIWIPVVSYVIKVERNKFLNKRHHCYKKLSKFRMKV